MPLVSVAVEYIEIHRKDSSDAEISRALKEQGFSDETLAAAFRVAGERPAVSATTLSPARRAFAGILFAASALLFICSALLFVRNFRQASAAAAAARIAP